ncbi:MAG: BON domain-containing protein [Azonexus sp.]
MNHQLIASMLVAGLLLLPVAGYTSDAETSTATEYVKDSVITTKIKAELAAEKMSSLVKINVDTDKHGAVLLSGSAASQSAVDKAVSIVKGVEGVISVKNEIKVVTDK